MFKGPKGRRRLVIVGVALAGLIIVIWYVRTHGNPGATANTGQMRHMRGGGHSSPTIT